MDVKVVETVKNGKTYKDVVIVIAGHDFILKPAPFYSVKAKVLYEHLLYNLADPLSK